MLGRRRIFAQAGLGLAALTSGCTCGHNRQVMYPGGAARNDDIRVRAPFVDIRVPRSSKVIAEEPVDIQPPLEVED